MIARIMVDRHVDAAMVDGIRLLIAIKAERLHDNRAVPGRLGDCAHLLAAQRARGAGEHGFYRESRHDPRLAPAPHPGKARASQGVRFRP